MSCSAGEERTCKSEQPKHALSPKNAPSRGSTTSRSFSRWFCFFGFGASIANSPHPTQPPSVSSREWRDSSRASWSPSGLSCDSEGLFAFEHAEFSISVRGQWAEKVCAALSELPLHDVGRVQSYAISAMHPLVKDSFQTYKSYSSPAGPNIYLGDICFVLSTPKLG
ncbi:hypothetical protein Slin15195_G125880 [Septoria linicola]|uniref:Uncharacterized protein n=1 Tax=Septoria linicola TaxID=215465 RepID=A0A9Q9B1J3_9PEZI|nr:hypothetical protein Slin14017_G082060 [Septoria linicola]USW59269.1 hypothetical protein Slin15195_G125880 [Septoria linicola]